MIRLPILGLLILLSQITYSKALDDCKLTPAQQEDSKIEHVYGGPLDDSTLYPRRAYVLSYNDTHLVPHWVAWHAIKSYRDTPKRKSRWGSFRTDAHNDLDTVNDKDYVGWYDSEDNFARGHIAPYFISGGDRDHDGKDAEFEDSLKIEDIDDACTVFEINSMANIAPQYHNRFNGSPGVWWQLETDVRDMIDQGKEFQVFAGSIFIKDKQVQKIGNRKKKERNWNIGVPHGFFKVVIDTNRDETVAFLFDHQADIPDGCNIDQASWPSECIVSIEEVEQATGLSFFSELTQKTNNRLRKSSNETTWSEWRNSNQ